MLSVIIVAAGSSRRMGFDKLFAQLGGRPVLWHSIRAFASLEAVDEVIVVTQSERVPQVEGLLCEATAHKRVHVVEGGAERHLSVWAGLKAVSSKPGRFVAIHDGARPLITAAAITGCLDLAGKEGAACCAAPIPDTVKRANDQGIVVESVDRTGLWAMQTPQIFSLELIRLAYVKLMEEMGMPTDEVSAVEGIGAKVALFQNADWNFKITFPKDIEMAAQVLSLRSREAGVQL
jgi:2-C-methyl-D-erythritol 4-phosphate cytidylyltransferase